VEVIFMATKRTYGVIAGLVMVGAAGWAADIRPWTRAEVAQANDLFGSRSGLAFTVTEPPPDPDSQALHVHAIASQGLRQTIVVATPATAEFPPDPCFAARIAPIDANGGGGQVLLHVARADAFAIEGPNGGALHLCASAPATPPGPPDDIGDDADSDASTGDGAWSASDVKLANAIFGVRSGLHFSVKTFPPDPILPPDPIRQALRARIVPIDGLEQNVVVATPGTDQYPPGPCFNARVEPTVVTNLGPTGGIVLHVERFGTFAIEGPNGEALGLCNRAGEHLQ
jgi:hypothetical protein